MGHLLAGRRLRSLSVAVALALLLSAQAVAAPAADGAGALELVASLTVGDGPTEVGYHLQAEGGAPRGPEALAVGPDGTLYLLDSVHGRVLILRNGAVTGAIPVPAAVYPRDLLATAGGLFILDDDNRVVQLAYDGRLVREVRLPAGLATHHVLRLAAGPGGRVSLWIRGYRSLDLDRLPAAVDMTETKEMAGSGIAGPDGRRWSARLPDPVTGLELRVEGVRSGRVQAQGLFGSARPVGFDRSGRLYFLVEDLYDRDGRLGVELTVRRYRPDGRQDGVLLLPGEEFVTSPHRPVEVAADGSVYVLVPYREGVAVYRGELGTTYRSRIPPRASALAAVTQGVPAEAGDASIQALSRRQVVDRAKTMATLTWTWYNSYDWFAGQFFKDSQDRPRPTDAVKPVQLEGTTDGAIHTGIPYVWGGFDSPWTKSDWATWNSWNDGLTKYRNQGKRGPLVGKTNTYCGAYPEICWPSGAYAGALGIDCSGYVAAASGNTYTTKPGTYHLMTAGYDWKGSDSMWTSIWRIQPGNFFVSNGHTLYYHYRLLDGTGVATLEATTDGNPQGAKAYVRTWTYLQNMSAHRSWWPMQKGDGPNDPLTTAGAGSACYGVSGQSVWYRFTVSGPRTVTISGISGGDPDLYVYDANLALVGESERAGSNSDSVSLPAAGTYYARVHIWSTGGSCVNWTITW